MRFPMPRATPCVTIVAAGLGLAPAMAPASDNDAALAAPVYPDAVALAHQDDEKSLKHDPRLGSIERIRHPDTRAFLTEAKAEKVRQFYESRDAAGAVSVHTLDREAHTQGEHGDWTSIGPFLRRFYVMANTCSEDLAYVMLRSKHSHLATGFYQLTDQRAEPSGPRLSQAEVIYRDCERRLKGQDKLWNKWKACLAKLDEHDYRTLIVIDQ